MLLDAAGIMYRGHYGFASSPLIRLSDSRHTSALYSFCNLLLSLLSSYQPTHLAAVLDVPSSSSYRRTLYPLYKAHRTSPPSDLSWQLRHLPLLCQRIGLTTAHHDGYEADDVIASIVHQLPHPPLTPHCTTAIVSQDKDFVQLLSDNVALLRFSAQPLAGRAVATAEAAAADKWRPVGLGAAAAGGRTVATFSLTPFTTASCVARYSIPPSRFIDFLALTGDASDNIPGVAWIGPVTASRLLAEYASLEELVEAAAQGKVAGKAGAELAKEGMREEVGKWRALVRMRKDLKVPALEEMEVDGWWEEEEEGREKGEGKGLSWERLVGALEELEFPTLVEKAKRLRDEERERRERLKREGQRLQGSEGEEVWRGVRDEQRVVKVKVRRGAVESVVEEEEEIDGVERRQRTLNVGRAEIPT